MSTDILCLNLLRAGNEEEAVLAMDRDALLNAWTELVVAGKEKPQAAVGPLHALLGMMPSWSGKTCFREAQARAGVGC